MEKIAVITGATGGMGQELVKELAQDHIVYACGRDQSKLDELAELPNVHVVRADLISEALSEKFSPELLGPSRIDVLVHAAAIADRRSVSDASLEDWRRQLDLNVVVPALLTKSLLPALRAAKGTAIFINSGAGMGPHPGHAVYAASKHALRGLADSLRKEESGNGVRVSTVSPGPTDTQMLFENMKDAGVAYEPEAYIQPREIARAVRMVVDAGASTQITEVAVRPRVELADR